MSGKIVGIVQCKNEWGLIAVSISHALTHHVDEVYVLNDASSDQTENGLEHLQKMWSGRLHIINTISIGFYQEAMVNTITHIARSAGADWLYVFDADEFLLLEEGYSLRSILHDLPARVSVVKYRVENFISPVDFDENELSHYRRLMYRSIPAKRQDVELAAALIYRGESTFFDIPFPGKVIFRASDHVRLRAGAHRVICYAEGLETVSDSRIRAAHFPLLTRKRLGNKARSGESHVKAGRGPRHGWQNQLIYRLEREGKLDWFWEQHAILKEESSSAPKHVADNDFIIAIAPTLNYLREGFRSENLKFVGDVVLESRVAKETMIPIHQVFQLSAVMQSQADKEKVKRPTFSAKLKNILGIFEGNGRHVRS